ncbi:hypothetical protein B0H14DRAFT_3152465 [Mycena olivaceomarginata]|nr:hypothetical protein B0H14DRAFT_3152465 [Mycena olivaceomarginata]
MTKVRKDRWRRLDEEKMWTHTRIRIGEGAVREGHRLEGDGRAIAKGAVVVLRARFSDGRREFASKAKGRCDTPSEPWNGTGRDTSSAAWRALRCSSSAAAQRATWRRVGVYLVEKQEGERRGLLMSRERRIIGGENFDAGHTSYACEGSGSGGVCRGRCPRIRVGVGGRGIAGKGKPHVLSTAEPGDPGLQDARVLKLEALVSLLHLLAEEQRGRSDSLDSNPVLRSSGSASESGGVGIAAGTADAEAEAALAVLQAAIQAKPLKSLPFLPSVVEAKSNRSLKTMLHPVPFDDSSRFDAKNSFNSNPLMATHRGCDLGIAPTASSKALLTTLRLESTSLGVYCHPTTYVALPVPAVPAPRSPNPPNRGTRSRRLGSHSHFVRCDPPDVY